MHTESGGIDPEHPRTICLLCFGLLLVMCSAAQQGFVVFRWISRMNLCGLWLGDISLRGASDRRVDVGRVGGIPGFVDLQR